MESRTTSMETLPAYPTKETVCPTSTKFRKMAPRSVANKITLGQKHVTVYASPKVGHALKTITENMNLYEGVQLMKVLEAVYSQGKKDGARNALEQIEQSLKVAAAGIPHKNPGKPKRK